MLSPSASELEIANEALALAREGSISSLQDRKPAARHMHRLFGTVRDRLQRETAWNFCRRETALAADTTPPATYANRFALPPGTLAVREVVGLGDADWEVAGEEDDSGPVLTWLLCDAPSATAILTRRVADPARWDATFRQCFLLHLAADVGQSLSLSANEAAEMRQRADALLAKAKRQDAREKARATITRSTSWLAARRRGRC